MAYCFNEDKSKVPVYSKPETDSLLSGKADNAGAEKTSNKVNSIRQASSASDTAYPSEKAVATALASKQDSLTIDSALSSSSTNPVQNRVINNALSNVSNWMPANHSTRMADYVTSVYNGTDTGTAGNQYWRKVYTVRTWNSGKKEYFAKVWCNNVACSVLSHLDCTYPSGTFDKPPVIVSSICSTIPGNTDSVHEYTHQMSVVSDVNACHINFIIEQTPDEYCDLYAYIHAFSVSSDWPQ